MPDKFSEGVGFSRRQKKMKLWLTVKDLRPVVQYDHHVVDQAKADYAKTYVCGLKRMGWLELQF